MFYVMSVLRYERSRSFLALSFPLQVEFCKIIFKWSVHHVVRLLTKFHTHSFSGSGLVHFFMLSFLPFLTPIEVEF